MAENTQQGASEIRYLNPVSVDVKKKKYCRFKKLGIKYVDYKDGEFLKKFLNEQGKILPRRLTLPIKEFHLNCTLLSSLYVFVHRYLFDSRCIF